MLHMFPIREEVTTNGLINTPQQLSALSHVTFCFPTVRANVFATSGKWYYEVELLTDGIIQIGIC